MVHGEARAGQWHVLERTRLRATPHAPNDNLVTFGDDVLNLERLIGSRRFHQVRGVRKGFDSVAPLGRRAMIYDVTAEEFLQQRS